jgi:undecaprenyl-diphosphatase
MDWIWRADQALQKSVNHDLHSPASDAVFRFLTYLGLDQVILPFVIVLIILRTTRRTGLTCFAAYAVAGLANLALKSYAPRLRPSSFAGTFVAPDESIFLSSFPSGHTTIAFAVAFAILLTWPGQRRIPVGVFSLTLAAWVGLSRIYRGVHWPTDVIAGMLLGFLGATVAYFGIAERPTRAVEETTHP